jgi:hypothetical protein
MRRVRQRPAAPGAPIAYFTDMAIFIRTPQGGASRITLSKKEL